MDIRPLTPHAPPAPATASFSPPASAPAPGDQVTLGTGPAPSTGVSLDRAADVLFEPSRVGGERTWITHMEDKKGPGNYQPVRLADGTVVVNGQEGTHAYHADGSLAWHLPTGNCSYRPPVLGADGTLYLRSDDKNLYAIRADGQGAEVLWKTQVGARGSSAGPVLDAHGRLYVADNDRRLHVYDSQGREVDHLDWEHLRSEEPELLPDGRLVLKGYDGYSAVFNPDAGSLLGHLFHGLDARLERVTHGQVLRPSGMGPDGAIYEAPDGHTIRVLEPDGKTVRWEHTLDQDTTSLHVTLRPDGTVYALSGDQLLTAISPEGRRLFTWQPDGPLAWDYVMDGEGTAYFSGSGANWKTYAVGADGRQLWSTELPSHGGNPALGPLDTLLVQGDLAPLRVLDRKSGRLVHEEPIPLAFGDHAVLAMQDGSLVAATERGDLVGLRITTPESARDEALAKAQDATPPEASAPTIERSEGFVVIGGVRVPIRPR